MLPASTAFRCSESLKAAPFRLPMRSVTRSGYRILFSTAGLRLDQANVPPVKRKNVLAMTTLMRIGWGADNPAFRQMWAAQFFPGGTMEQFDSFDELQRRTTSPECAARYLEAVGGVDVTGLLGKVTAPTLVMHVRGRCESGPSTPGVKWRPAFPAPASSRFKARTISFWSTSRRAQRFFEEVKLFLGR